MGNKVFSTLPRAMCEILLLSRHELRPHFSSFFSSYNIPLSKIHSAISPEGEISALTWFARWAVFCILEVQTCDSSTMHRAFNKMCHLCFSILLTLRTQNSKRVDILGCILLTAVLHLAPQNSFVVNYFTFQKWFIWTSKAPKSFEKREV